MDVKVRVDDEVKADDRSVSSLSFAVCGTYTFSACTPYISPSCHFFFESRKVNLVLANPHVCSCLLWCNLSWRLD